MRLLTILTILFFSCIDAIAGGTSYNIKILTFKETAKDRYTMTFQRIVKEGQEQQPVVTLRLRHNEYYYSKKESSSYTTETYREAVMVLREHFKKGSVFPFGAIGGAWGIPVKNTKNEYWVQTIANIKEYDGREVVYAFKE
jgi:hypothetical protein